MIQWKKEEVFHSGDSYFNKVFEKIRLAKSTIDIETYIFTRESLGEKLLELLKEKTSQGVSVRLLLDGIGCSNWTSPMIAHLNELGISTKVYHPLPWQYFEPKTRSSVLTLFRLKNFINNLFKINKRNHRKVCIIDNWTAFLGGMNISDAYLNEKQDGHAWRDTGACIEGPEVSYLSEAFELAWSNITPRSLNHKLKNTPSLIKLNNTLTKRRDKHRELISLILNSQKRIWIITPYLVPDPSFILALKYAASSKVDIRFILPKKIDLPFMSIVNRGYYSILLRAGVQIYEYLPRILHAKAMLIDDRIIVGSSNQNHRSLVHDLEVDVILSHPSSLKSVENQFLEDLNLSENITLDKALKRPILALILDKIILFFKYWI
jgi:cardiolipin synthase